MVLDCIDFLSLRPYLLCLSVKRKSGTASEIKDIQLRKQKACFVRATGCGSLSISTSVSLLANEFDVRSVLHVQKSSAAVNQIHVIHDAMNGCKNLKIDQRFATTM